MRVAYKHIFDRNKTISFIYKLNNMGPNTEARGIPESEGNHDD